jgi:hypothetical protein
MNWLEDIVQMPVSEVLGWTVLHSLWQGRVLAWVLALVLWGSRSARVRYATAYLALVILAACFIVTWLHLLPSGHSGLHRRSLVQPF